MLSRSESAHARAGSATLLATLLLLGSGGPSAAVPSSASCMDCHDGIEQMHPEVEIEDPDTGEYAVREITCVECHGGDGTRFEKAEAHVVPKNKDLFGVREYRQSSYAAINGESPEFIRFMNPGDLRVADRACGSCHDDLVKRVRKSIMAHNSMVHNAVFFNNGAVERKVPQYGEAFTPDGRPARLTDTSEISPEAKARGALKSVRPHPEPKATKARDIFRIFEPGNFEAGERFTGTDGKIAVVYLNVLKTRLNDPSLWFIGTNEQSGDFRHSGCAACHSLYANDRDRFESPSGRTIYHAGTLPELFDSAKDFMEWGNKGVSRSGSSILPHDVGGFPVIHKLTRSVPTSQCVTCHHHQGNGAILSYEGSLWWDYETDAETVRKVGGWAVDPYAYAPDMSEQDRLQMLGKQDELSEHNDEMEHVQFADQHGHGWNFRKVFKRDRKGNLLDADGEVVPPNDPKRFAKAVHLRDIHFEKGLHCIDCHTEQDVHGDGHIYAQMTDAIEIECVDCHGSVTEKATLVSSGPAGGNRLDRERTPFGRKWLEWKGDRLIQRSKVYPDLQWEVSQVVNAVDPGHPEFNARAAYSMAMRSDGSWNRGPGPQDTLAHSTDEMECYACHSSWNTVCSGCHLPFDPNIAVPDKHYQGEVTRGYAPYNGQVLRSDLFALGIGTYNKGYKIQPVRSATAVVVSAKDRNGNVLVHQQPTISTNGFSGLAISPNMPHTVRREETVACSGCHPSRAGDNNAWLSILLGPGANTMNFVGKYAYVASGEGGFTGVVVTRGEEPQPVIGSRFHEVLHEGDFRQFVKGDRKLDDGVHRPTKNARSLAVQGEYVYVADGPGGFAVYDIAFIDNKSKTPAQRIADNRKALFDSGIRLETPNALDVALPSSTPISLDRNRRRHPDDMEQAIHPLYGYAALADEEDGLILVNIETFTDRNPENNDIERSVTFNPDGKLTGARKVRFVGSTVYVACGKNGFHVVDVDDPEKPRLVASIGGDALGEVRDFDVQLRYAFLTGSRGLQTVDVTDLRAPKVVAGASVPLNDAQGIHVYRTTALVADGKNGLAMIDVTKPAEPKLLDHFTASGQMNDARDVTTGMVNVSTFAYVADGKNGLRVVQLIEPDSTPGALGFAPPMRPELIATYPTRAPAVSVADGQIRDRPVDESGNQISATGRMGSRPFRRDEMNAFLLRSDGTPFAVRDFADLPDSEIPKRRATAAKKPPRPAREPAPPEKKPAGPGVILRSR